MPFLRFIIVFDQKTRFLSISEFFLLTKRSFNESGLFFIRVREVFWKILFQIFYGFYDFRWLCKTLRQTESSKSPHEFNPNTSPLKRRMPNYQYIKEFNFNKITFFHLFLFFIGKMIRAIDVDVATMSTNHRHSYINLKRQYFLLDTILKKNNAYPGLWSKELPELTESLLNVLQHFQKFFHTPSKASYGQAYLHSYWWTKKKGSNQFNQAAWNTVKMVKLSTRFSQLEGNKK